MSITRRNPNPNDSATAARMAAASAGSRLVGNSKPASLMALDRTLRTMFGAMFRSASESINLYLNAPTITNPRTATARTPATLATALLIPEAVPARSCATELITTVVKGATLTAIPKPSTMNAGKNVAQ